MKTVKIISGICFGLAIGIMLLVFFDVRIDFIPRTPLLLTVVALGAAGMILNLLSPENSKHNPIYTIFYWSAMLSTLLGITFKILHWPFSTYILYSGIILMLVAMFLPKRRDKEDKEDSDILDDFS